MVRKTQRGRRNRPVYDKPAEQIGSNETRKNCEEDCGHAGVEVRRLKEEIRAFANEIKERSEAGNTKDARKRELDIWTWRTIAAYTVLTLLLLVLSYCQFREIRMQTVTMSRAWLHPENIKMTISDDGRSISILGDTRNVGKEPASHVLFSRPEGGFIPIHSTQIQTFDIPDDDMCSGSERWKATGSGLNADRVFWSTIFLDGTLDYERQIRVEPLDATPANALGPSFFRSELTATRGVYWLRDCVSYVTLGEHHSSAFCYFLIQDPIKKSLQTYPCADGNEAK